MSSNITARMRSEAERLGTVPYLLTTGDDGRPHAISVQVAWTEDGLSVQGGRRSLANAAARRLISVMWPAPSAAEHALFVDGEASVEGDTVRLRPTRAVLHRSGPAPAGAPSTCTSDCTPLFP